METRYFLLNFTKNWLKSFSHLKTAFTVSTLKMFQKNKTILTDFWSSVCTITLNLRGKTQIHLCSSQFSIMPSCARIL